MGHGGVIHCRCSRCFSFPSKRRIRKRPRVLTLLSLPEDVLFHVLKGLPAEDILSVRAVSLLLLPLCHAPWLLSAFRSQDCTQKRLASCVRVNLKKTKEYMQ
uniref:F-box domain-containing protein n=1 Tax=Buteo japonicus TaxID=224669 RepID=A0A8C0BEZ1_9AVES